MFGVPNRDRRSRLPPHPTYIGVYATLSHSLHLIHRKEYGVCTSFSPWYDIKVMNQVVRWFSKVVRKLLQPKAGGRFELSPVRVRA